MLFENQEVSLELTAHFPEEIQRGLAASTTPLFPPLPCTHLLSLQSAEERWSGTYSGPGCWLHSLRFQPLGCPGVRAGLQKGRFCSSFFALKRASMERCMLTDLFTPQQMSKNGWEGGECGDGGFGVNHVQCAISPPSIGLLLPVCVFCSVIQSVLTLWVSMDCSPPGSSDLLVSAQGK